MHVYMSHTGMKVNLAKCLHQAGKSKSKAVKCSYWKMFFTVKRLNTLQVYARPSGNHWVAFWLVSRIRQKLLNR